MTERVAAAGAGRIRIVGGALGLVAVATFTLAGCRHGPATGAENEQLELADTLPDFLARQRAASATGTSADAALNAWKSYEAINASYLKPLGATDDPGDALLMKLAIHPDAVVSIVDAFDSAAVGEAHALISDFQKRIGPLPPGALVFGVARPWQPVLRGTVDGRPVILLNARHPDLANAATRRAVMARELFTLFHRVRVPESASQGPLARRVFREGAAMLAVRALVPDAPEQEILGIPPEHLGALRARQSLIARELLAAIDSASDAEAARFFSPDVKDPLLPRGAGRFISDRVYQKLARELGSTERPLRLSSSEFVQRSRAILDAMARGEN